MNPLLFLLLITPAGLTVPQEHVLPVFGCGTGCRVETEQLSLPEQMPDGWIKVKVRQRTWITRCDWSTTPLECIAEPASGSRSTSSGTLVICQLLWEKFATSKTQTEAMLGNRMSSIEKGNSLDTRNMGPFMEIPL